MWSELPKQKQSQAATCFSIVLFSCLSLSLDHLFPVLSDLLARALVLLRFCSRDPLLLADLRAWQQRPVRILEVLTKPARLKFSKVFDSVPRENHYSC